ncbi:hypothetical protein L596_012087 [Steinernema carpocapsae]|uniref:Uncharacterized protein n=1 Tax=Steinernema carpocapsae TaxID=34508 RepID=A0A4V6A4R5_STECR|nr:hypothetical protein L596_012087 [Steinernema carpocapsae]
MTSIEKCYKVLESFRNWFLRKSRRPIATSALERERRSTGDDDDGGLLQAPPARVLNPNELLNGSASAESAYAYGCAFTLWTLLENDFQTLRNKVTNEQFKVVAEAFVVAEDTLLRDELLKIFCFLVENEVLSINRLSKEIREEIIVVLIRVLNNNSSKSDVCRDSLTLITHCSYDSDKSFELIDGCTKMLIKDYSLTTVVGREIVKNSCSLIAALLRNAKGFKREHVYADYIIRNRALMEHLMEFLAKYNPADENVNRTGLILDEDNLTEVFVWEYLAEFFVDLMYFSRKDGILFLYHLGFFKCMFSLFQKPHHQGRFKAARLLDEACEKDDDIIKHVLDYNNEKSLADIFLTVLRDPTEDLKRILLVLYFTQELFRNASSGEQLENLCETGLICTFFHEVKRQTPDLEMLSNRSFALQCLGLQLEDLLQGQRSEETEKARELLRRIRRGIQTKLEELVPLDKGHQDSEDEDQVEFELIVEGVDEDGCP